MTTFALRHLVAALALLAAGAAIGVVTERVLRQEKTVATAQAYVCPMHPDVVRHEPGTCPVCGMSLVPHDAHDHADGPAVVTLAPGEVTALNVRTARVRRETLTRSITVSGYVQNYSAGGTAPLAAPVAGRVASVAVAAGRLVRSRDVLLEIDAPEFVAAQEKFLQALASGDIAQSESLRQQLTSYGLDAVQIGQLESTRRPAARLRVHAPVDASVGEISVRAGDNVAAGGALLTLLIPGQAVVDAELLSSELLWMKAGDRAELRLPQTPGRVWPGTVAVDSVLANPQRRVFLVRMHFPMPAGIVTGSQTGEVRITGAARAALAVPRDAVIRTGREARVVRALGEGRYQPVTVQPGIESGERMEILSGLRDGDEIVINAQFLIDAESSQRAEYRRLDAKPPRGTP
jgi:Cu(I)/Ag(I) efflux system membrane fusion protein